MARLESMWIPPVALLRLALNQVPPDIFSGRAKIDPVEVDTMATEVQYTLYLGAIFIVAAVLVIAASLMCVWGFPPSSISLSPFTT